MNQRKEYTSMQIFGMYILSDWFKQEIKVKSQNCECDNITLERANA